MRKLSVFLLVVLCLFISKTAIASYTITELPFGPYAINNSGQVVGMTKRIAGDGLIHGYLWENGVLTDVGSLGGDVWAWDINDFGMIAGTSDTVVGSPYNSHGFLWANGILTDLGTLPGGRMAKGYGINSSGYVAGDSRNSSDVCTAVLWNPDLQITILVANNSTAYAINDSNQVVGVSNSRAFLWENNVLTNLGTLPGGNYSHAYDVNNYGQVVGRSHVGPSQADHAFLWENGLMTDLEDFEGGTGSSVARAINNHGQIVGNAGGIGAVIWYNGKMTKLDDFVDPESGWKLSVANDINDKGK